MLDVSWLSPHDVEFPSTQLALKEPNGLLAVGGDLSLERLISAYRLGIFPWYEEPQPILWWSPSPRAVLFPEKLKISKSLKKRIRRQEYRITCDTAFSQVMQHCAKVPRNRQHGTWITTDMHDAYCSLHSAGVAHSVEAWFEEQLVGGLYGLSIGGIFFGESMFSLRTDASKVAFSHLVFQLKRSGCQLIDCQVSNPHLLSLGAEEIDRASFEHLLKANIDNETPGLWQARWTDNILA